MAWDPSGTLGQALWITGGQWAGKSTVARILAVRHGLTAYHYDYHDARGHLDRRTANNVPVLDPETAYITNTPAETAAWILKHFPLRFDWALDDLRALFSSRPIISEGWGLRPELAAPIMRSLNQMIVMVPTGDFRQAATLPRTNSLTHHLSNPDLAQGNRLERDRLIAEDCVNQARHLGIRVLEVDGTKDAEAIADEVSTHFNLTY